MYKDEIIYSESTMGGKYEKAVTMNFHEYIHDEEDTRYILHGSGYFDLRMAFDPKWARIKVAPGDLIVLTKGI